MQNPLPPWRAPESWRTTNDAFSSNFTNQACCLVFFFFWLVWTTWAIVKPLPPCLVGIWWDSAEKDVIEPHCFTLLSAGWTINTRVGDSVLVPVFTEREINKLLNLKPYILSSSRVHFGRRCQVFLCLWPSFERTGCLRKTPSLCLSPSFVFKGRLKGLHCLLTAARMSGRQGQEWRTHLSIPSKVRSYTWYLPYTHIVPYTYHMCTCTCHMHYLTCLVQVRSADNWWQPTQKTPDKDIFGE